MADSSPHSPAPASDEPRPSDPRPGPMDIDEPQQPLFGTVVSRASTPAPDPTATNLAMRSKNLAAPRTSLSTDPQDGKGGCRYRPRTFSYMSLLPFEPEPEEFRDEALDGILRHLYICLRSEDYSPGAMFWSRQLQSYLQLKFEIPRTLRAKLTTIYYHLALAPGLDTAISERCINMVITLTRKYHYLKPGVDLTLDWRPLWNQLGMLLFPNEFPPHETGRRKPHKLVWKLLIHAKAFFDPRDRKEMLQEFLPFFSTSNLANAYSVAGLLNAMFPTQPAPPSGDAASLPEDFLPTLFHIWALVARSRVFDTQFVDLFCNLAKDFVKDPNVTFSQYGIFTKEQSDQIFTAILRLTDIPVGQADSPYGSADYGTGIAACLEKDKKRFPVSYLIARWIVNSLSPLCLDHEESVISNLEGLIESIETFFHPSNSGAWTAMLGQLTHYLVDLFVLRWNREQSGELAVPEGRRITRELKQRFVLCLRDVTFVGLFCKSPRVAHYYYGALHGLAYLEPSLILPGALQRFYPSLQGLVEVHRTTAGLYGLQVLANIISNQKGFRCHLTALLALALPGIDANDLNKTQHTLTFIQSVAYSIPISPLAGDGHGNGDGGTTTSLASEWVQAEMERMEREGQDVQLDYNAELTDEQEANILKSSTAGFGEFVLTLLGKVFTLLENLPDWSHLKTGTPEEHVINALPSALAPMFATLSPELFDLALDKLCNFVSSHVVHQARDAMAWIINALCKANSEKTLKAFVPMLIVNIRNEIDHNHAASDRSSGSDYLPRDRALVWNVVMLAMVIVHVGSPMLKYKDDLFGITKYMQAKCRGLPTIHIANLVHHMLLTLTRTYPVDHALYEPEVVARGLTVDDWGKATPPSELSIRWHRPSPADIEFAEELFAWQAKWATETLRRLMSDEPPMPRKGKNKEWSDEMVRILQQIRLTLSGMATLFDPERASAAGPGSDADGDADMAVDGGRTEGGEDDELLAEVAEDEEMRPSYRYGAGYVLKPDQPVYERIHKLREDLGELLSDTHAFLNANQEDDVACFTALYTAYRTWITDVGVERSAHPLERHLRLYRSHIAPFKVSGLRKVYPRPLLINRAEAYHIQRVKNAATTRRKGTLDKRLLLDLAESCLSPYADVRCVAQNVQDASLKTLIAVRPLVVPVLMEKFRKAIEAEDHDRIKGGMYTLFFTSLARTVSKDWRFAPDAIRLYIATSRIDKQSIQTLGSKALVTVLDFGKPADRVAIVDVGVIDAIKPREDHGGEIQTRNAFVLKRRDLVQDLKARLGLELTAQAKEAHWKIASRCAVLAAALCIRFATVAPPEFVELATLGVNDPHPGLRSTHAVAFGSLLTAVDMRATYGHDFTKMLLGKEARSTRIEVPVENGDGEFTAKFLASFEDPGKAEYLVDTDYPGWLVWGKKFTASNAGPESVIEYDDVENRIRSQMGKLLTREWFGTLFDYLKQEPRDSNFDRFRMSNLYLLSYAFDLVHCQCSAATWDDIKELTEAAYGDGSDKHQHRATSEIVAALLVSSIETKPPSRGKVWEFAAPLMIKVMTNNLTPESLPYWMSALHVVADGKDPRRYHELADALKGFRIDMSSNAAFKDSSKIMLLDTALTEAGWRLRGVGPVLDEMLAHLDHPYKSVREAMGRCIASLYRASYHESFRDVDALLKANKEASSLGLRPYGASPEFSRVMTEVFDRLEKWRQEREPGQQTPSAYTSGSKTVLAWLESTLLLQECTQLVPFFPAPFMEQLLHMMDVKEDPELLSSAYHVYRHIPNVPLRPGEDEPIVGSLVRIGRTAPSWHQRLRALINLQVVYFRSLFLMQPQTRESIFEAVGDMLADHQLEVRTYASNTLAGMIRCLPKRIRDPAVERLKARFFTELELNPMPQRRRPGDANSLAGGPSSSSGTATPADVQAQIVRRHAAVLGLSALIEAFPYATPPPKWMPEVLATLASRAASDPGAVGKATKAILSDFKKTRHDSWSVDQKYFTPEQLEDLEGVLWKSYFA